MPRMHPESHRRTAWTICRALALASIHVIAIFLFTTDAQARSVSCYATMPKTVIGYISGSGLKSIGLAANVACTATPVGSGGAGPAGNASGVIGYRLCSLPDAATATGTGGTTVSPRQLKSAQGNSMNYELQGTRGDVLTAAGYYMGGAPNVITTNTSGNAVGMNLQIPNQTIPSGDYETILSLTMGVEAVEVNASGQFVTGNALTCGSGTNLITTTTPALNIPMVIRVASTCTVTGTSDMDFGAITVTSGNVQATGSVTGASMKFLCPDQTAWSMAIGNGNNYDAGTGNRRMRNGSSYLSYTLVDSRGNAITGPITGTSTGSGTVSSERSAGFYGQLVSQSAAGMATGIYTDTLILTLTY